MRRCRVSAARAFAPVAFAAALLTACGGGGGSPGTALPHTVATATPAPNGHVGWTMFGFDDVRSGKNPAETTLGRANVASLHLHWSYATAGAIYAQPVLAANVALASGTADVLYVVDESGGVTALNAATGATVWKQTFPDANSSCGDLPQWGITSTPVVDRARNALFVIDGTGAAHALNLATGATAPGWPASVQLNVPTLTYTYAALAEMPNGTLYATSAGYCDDNVYQAAVYALDASSGRRLETWYPQSAPNYGNGIWGAGGVVADPRAAVSDVYVATGNAFPESALYSDSVVRVTASLSPVAANWRYAASVPNDDDFGAAPLTFVAPGCLPQLVVLQKNGQLDLYDLDAVGAGPVQQIAIGSPSIEGLNIGTASYDAATGTVYVANALANAPYGQGVLAFSLFNCQLVLAWQHAAAGAPSPLSQPVIANGVVYYATGSGKTIAALDAATGALLWTSPAFGAPSYTAPAVVNGSVFAGSFDKHVYAFGL
jgi:outer membrane protein assembly factor BamB